MLSHTMETVLHTVFSFESVGSIHKGWFVLAILVSCFRNTHFIVSASGRDSLDITGKQRVSFQHHQLSIFFTSSPYSASPSPSPLPFTSLSRFGDRHTLHSSKKEEELPLSWASGTSCIKICYQVKTP